jgi:hypothetical protein
MRSPLIAGEPGGDVWIGILGKDWWIRPGDDRALSDDYFRYRRSGAVPLKVFSCADRNDYPHLVALQHPLSFKTAYNFVLIPASDVSADLPGTTRVVIPGEPPQPVFLSAWSAGGWLEVAPGLQGEDSVDFGACAAADHLYLPTTPGPRGLPAPAGDPFLLHPDGTRTLLVPGAAEQAWTWSPIPGEPSARPALWRAGTWVSCVVETRAGTSTVRGFAGALYVVLRPGPENGGVGKFFGRPFTISPDGLPQSR